MQKTKSGPSSATTQNAGIMKKDPSIQELNALHADGTSEVEESHNGLKFYFFRLEQPEWALIDCLPTTDKY